MTENILSKNGIEGVIERLLHGETRLELNNAEAGEVYLALLEYQQTKRALAAVKKARQLAEQVPGSTAAETHGESKTSYTYSQRGPKSAFPDVPLL